MEPLNLPWRAIVLLWKNFVLAFTALLPLVNPLGSALIFLGLVGPAADRRLSLPLPHDRHQLPSSSSPSSNSSAPAILAFFGISLPIVQLSGGSSSPPSAGTCSTRQTATPTPKKRRRQQRSKRSPITSTLEEKAFYPFTFPITAGPGCIVVMLTLSARTVQPTLADTVIAHLGVFLAAVRAQPARLSLLLARPANRQRHLSRHRSRHPARHSIYPRLHRQFRSHGTDSQRFSLPSSNHA